MAEYFADPGTGGRWVKFEVVMRTESHALLVDWLAKIESSADSRAAQAWVREQAGWTPEMCAFGLMLEDIAQRLTASS